MPLVLTDPFDTWIGWLRSLGAAEAEVELLEPLSRLASILVACLPGLGSWTAARMEWHASRPLVLFLQVAAACQVAAVRLARSVLLVEAWPLAPVDLTCVGHMRTCLLVGLQGVLGCVWWQNPQPHSQQHAH